VGNAITITGDDGPNVISVNNVGDFIMYEDLTGPNIVAGAGCYQENPSLINCGQGGVGLKATIALGSGDDTYDDRLARTDWPVVELDAGDGNDTNNGAYSNDVLRGGAGNDTLRGIAGDDQIDGGPGDDTIHGGAGNDTVIGGLGRDLINGDGDYSGSLAEGNDTIQARDGEIDRVACGFGADSAVLDADDVVDLVTDCEAVDRSGGSGGGGGSTPAPTPPAETPAPATLTVALAKPKPIGLRALAGGRAVTITATISQPCAATLKLAVSAAEARRAKLARVAVTLATAVKAAPAGTLRASLTVRKAYRSKLRRLKRLKATLSIACAASPGATTTKAMRITLRR
jgi:Ca2+-binding RTX toxin-like protein